MTYNGYIVTVTVSILVVNIGYFLLIISVFPLLAVNIRKSHSRIIFSYVNRNNDSTEDDENNVNLIIFVRKFSFHYFVGDKTMSRVALSLHWYNTANKTNDVR